MSVQVAVAETSKPQDPSSAWNRPRLVSGSIPGSQT
jgi:hypothetical protein